MVERSRIPANGRMAICAVAQRECRTRSRVHRIVGLLPGRCVAPRGTASCRCNLQIVIVINVAGSAGYVRMSIRQKKTRSAVIEDYVGPADRVMAL